MCVQFMKKADRSGDGTLDRNEFKSFIEVCCLIDEAIEAGVPAESQVFPASVVCFRDSFCCCRWFRQALLCS